VSRDYEAVYIFDSTLEDAAINDKLTRYHGLLPAAGEIKSELEKIREQVQNIE
jgi:uncharacterized protein YicC (UPF0701 family)